MLRCVRAVADFSEEEFQETARNQIKTVLFLTETASENTQI